MSNQDDRYRDGDHTAVREPVAGQQHHLRRCRRMRQQSPTKPAADPPQYGYGPPQGYGHGWGDQLVGMRPRREYPIETKPSPDDEFVGSVLAIFGIAVTAAASDAFGACRAWILITAIVVGYMVSRGIAKSGTRSSIVLTRENTST